MKRKLCIGVDYGTDSVRSVLVDSSDGKEIASSVFEYTRWKKGLFCNAYENQFRQHPLDYIEGLISTIRSILKADPEASRDVVAISIDTTGSTPVAVNKEGIPLSLLPEFAENPDAMFILWKDHTAIAEADQINSLSHSWEIDYTKYSGGTYSSEWFFAKILHVLKNNESISKSAFSWVEHCDWMPALLTGNTDPIKLKRSRCAAGHKAMWNIEWDGLPSERFLSALNPKLKGIRSHLYQDTVTSNFPVGTLSQEWAEKLDLNQSVIVGAGAFDAHVGAVGGEIKVNYLSKVIGTSTCDMLIAPMQSIGNRLIKGISGQVDGSIVPGMIGLEAGQSAFGDIYAWYRDLLTWPLKTFLNENDPVYIEIKSKLIEKLSSQASMIPFSVSEVVAIDWMNGRRTPDADPHLKGVIANLTLGSDAPRIFKALVAATAFGAKKIVDRFTESGLTIDGIIALGGVAKKSPYVMQVLSDVLNMPIKVVRSEHTCALGAAMFAAVVSGIYPTVELAQEAMGQGFDMEYTPIPENADKYRALFEDYSSIGSFIETFSQDALI